MANELAGFVNQRWMRGQEACDALPMITALVRVAASIFAATEWSPTDLAGARASLHRHLDKWIDRYEKRHRDNQRRHAH
jgi:hypothetical protein